jgi:hypothetical protein
MGKGASSFFKCVSFKTGERRNDMQQYQKGRGDVFPIQSSIYSNTDEGKINQDSWS